MYNDKLVYKVVIWAFFGISLWKENVALMCSLLLNEYAASILYRLPILCGKVCLYTLQGYHFM